jgi:acylpyruvate hydrolase
MSIDKIICVGKNYHEHAKELGDAIPEKPVIFLKPASTLLQANNWDETIIAHYPQHRGELHHEIEIVLQLTEDAYQITPTDAEKLIGAVTIGLDMTLRTEQTKLKKQGHPWTIAKVFKDAAILGPWIAIEDFPYYLYQEFTLTIDEILRQHGYGREMNLSPRELISYISQYLPLSRGDIIFTGTPAGVGPVLPGQLVTVQWQQYSLQIMWE